MSKRKHYDGDRFIGRREYEEDISWANNNFKAMDKNNDSTREMVADCNEHIEEERRWTERQFDTFAKAHNNLNKRVRRMEGRECIHLLLTGVLTYIVCKHDKILTSYNRRMERLEFALRNGRGKDEKNEV